MVSCEDCRTISFHHLLWPSTLKLKEPLQGVTRKGSSSVALETRECEVVTHALFFFQKICVKEAKAHSFLGRSQKEQSLSFTWFLISGTQRTFSNYIMEGASVRSSRKLSMLCTHGVRNI